MGRVIVSIPHFRFSWGIWNCCCIHHITFQEQLMDRWLSAAFWQTSPFRVVGGWRKIVKSCDFWFLLSGYNLARLESSNKLKPIEYIWSKFWVVWMCCLLLSNQRWLPVGSRGRGQSSSHCHCRRLRLPAMIAPWPAFASTQPPQGVRVF